MKVKYKRGTRISLANYSEVEIVEIKRERAEKKLSRKEVNQFFVKQNRDIARLNEARSNAIRKYVYKYKQNNRRPASKIYDNVTKVKLAKMLYRTQCTTSKVRKHLVPAYTVGELTTWLLLQPKYHVLYGKWKASRYITKLKPSIDRLNNSKGYFFDNIRIVTWKENIAAAVEDKRIGDLSGGVYYGDFDMKISMFTPSKDYSYKL